MPDFNQVPNNFGRERILLSNPVENQQAPSPSDRLGKKAREAKKAAVSTTVLGTGELVPMPESGSRLLYSGTNLKQFVEGVPAHLLSQLITQLRLRQGVPVVNDDMDVEVISADALHRQHPWLAREKVRAVLNFYNHPQNYHYFENDRGSIGRMPSYVREGASEVILQFFNDARKRFSYGNDSLILEHVALGGTTVRVRPYDAVRYLGYMPEEFGKKHAKAIYAQLEAEFTRIAPEQIVSQPQPDQPGHA